MVSKELIGVNPVKERWECRQCGNVQDGLVKIRRYKITIEQLRREPSINFDNELEISTFECAKCGNNTYKVVDTIIKQRKPRDMANTVTFDDIDLNE